MKIFKIDNQIIDAQSIENISDIMNFRTFDPTILSFTIKLKNGSIINYVKEYSPDNQLATLLELEELQLKIKKEIKKEVRNDYMSVL